MKALKVKDLLNECMKQVRLGNGDKTIMISQDDEGNGYHYLWYSFQTIEDYEKPIEYNGHTFQEDFYYTSDNVAKKEDTIILG